MLVEGGAIPPTLLKDRGSVHSFESRIGVFILLAVIHG